MQHADDDFLADVAPLRERDRPLLDAGFERNRVVSSCRRRRPGIQPRCARLRRIAARRHARPRQPRTSHEWPFRRAREKHAIAGHAELVDARDDTGSPPNVALRVLIVRASRRDRRCRSSTPPSDAAACGPCIQTLVSGFCHRFETHVFGEDELVQPRERAAARLSRDVQQDHPARLEHVHVGQHPALRRQPGRIAAGAGRQRLDVVGEQSLQIEWRDPPRPRQSARGGKSTRLRRLRASLESSAGSVTELLRFKVDAASLAASLATFLLYVRGSVARSGGSHWTAAGGSRGTATGASRHGYTTFCAGSPIGREDVTVRSDASGPTVTSEGRVGAPANLVIRRAEFRYGPDGAPAARSSSRAPPTAVTSGSRTTVAGNTATTESTQAATVATPVNPQALLHANGIVASYVAMARRLGDTAPGSEIRVLVVPQTEIGVRPVNVQNDRMQLGADFLGARRYDVILLNPSDELGRHRHDGRQRQPAERQDPQPGCRHRPRRPGGGNGANAGSQQPRRRAGRRSRDRLQPRRDPHATQRPRRREDGCRR